MHYGKKPKPNPKIPNHIQFDTVSPATKLLEKRRQMYEVHEAFEAQRQEFKNQEDNFKRQEALIRERDLGIQEDLIKFCKFLQDNDHKKQRAEKRYEDEVKNVNARIQELNELNQQIENLQKDSTRLERKVVSLKKYEDYLELVAKKYPDQYPDVTEIVTRFTSLDQANRNLKKNHDKIGQELERARNALALFEKEQMNENMVINTSIAALQKQLDDKEKLRQKLQNEVEGSRNEASTLNARLGKILMAIENIFDRCVEGSKNLNYKFEDQTEKLRKEKAEKNKKLTMIRTQSPKKGEKKDEKAGPATEDNYQKAGERAENMLKKIGSYLYDFGEILKECRKEEAQKKQATKKKETPAIATQ